MQKYSFMFILYFMPGKTVSFDFIFFFFLPEKWEEWEVTKWLKTV